MTTGGYHTKMTNNNNKKSITTKVASARCAGIFSNTEKCCSSIIFQFDFLFLCMLVKCFNEHSHHLSGIGR